MLEVQLIPLASPLTIVASDPPVAPLLTQPSNAIGAGSGETLVATLSFQATNASGSPAALTVLLEKRDDAGAWGTVAGRDLELAAGAQACATILGIGTYTGADYGPIQFRALVSCIGANVELSQAELLMHGTYQKF